MSRTNPQYAGIGRRGAAVIIDTIIIAVIGGALGVGAMGFGADLTSPVNLAATALGLLYFILLEGYLDGQTLGKKLLKIRVVREDGGDLDLRGAVLRNVLRIIDALPFFYLIGILVIYVSDHNQRIGDLVGDTYVVRA